MSRQGHKDAPMRYLNPDEVAEKIPILNMDNVSKNSYFLSYNQIF